MAPVGEHTASGEEAIAWAVAWCRTHPAWRLSLQTHKLLGIP
jgi:organic radical activating enzyme